MPEITKTVLLKRILLSQPMCLSLIHANRFSHLKICKKARDKLIFDKKSLWEVSGELMSGALIWDMVDVYTE